MLALGLALASCAQPTTVAGCGDLGDAAEREDCRWRLVEPLAGDDAALAAALAEVTPAESRDLLLLRLSIAHPTRAGAFCRQVTTPGAQEKCKQVLGRPHLGTAPRNPRPPGSH